MRGTPDAHGFGDGLVTSLRNGDFVFTLTEAFPSIVARLVEDDVFHSVGGLFAFVQVGEAHARALRAVGAVEQHLDVNVVEIHILVDAAASPSDLALAAVRIFVAVVFVDAAHAPLVDASGNVLPVHVNELRVGRSVVVAQQDHIVAAVGVCLRQVAVGAIDSVEGERTVGFFLFSARSAADLDVVDHHAVASGVDAAVLGVFPTEGVVTGGEFVLVGLPASAACASGELGLAVKDELADIPARAFTHAEGGEADGASVRQVSSGFDGRSGAGLTGVAASQAVAASIDAVGADHPRIGGIVGEVVLAEVASLEVDETAVPTANHAPVDTDILEVFVRVRVVFSPNGAVRNRSEVLVHDEVGRQVLVVDNLARVGVLRNRIEERSAVDVVVVAFLL